jgi:hypothetical protein
VRREDKGYILTLVVEHGKDKKGNPNMQRFTFKGEPAEGGLVFQDANYTLTVKDGKVTGGRTGKVVSTVALERKPALNESRSGPASETKPPTPGPK